MIIRTRVFELANGKYPNIATLARAMELSISQLYRVREGKRGINQKFIIGAQKAFPQYRLDELFYLSADQAADSPAKTPVPVHRNHPIR